MNNSNLQVTWASSLNVLAGLWLIIDPFVLQYPLGIAARTNDIILGIVIGVIALIRVFYANKNTSWLSWVNVILGLWLIISPFVLKYSYVASSLWNDIILGIIVVILGAISALATTDFMSRINR